MVGAPVKTAGPPTIPAQKPRPATPQREAGSNPRRPGRLGPIIRVAISLLIVWHFTGVFLAALSIPVSSPLVMKIAQRPPMQWYLDALYMNQGHSFFAPDVGPGHLIRYELFDQSGRVTEQGELPSRKEHWPRLFYHRHLMLADQSELPTQDKQSYDYWQRMYLEGYGRHLLRVNESAQSVRLQRIAHLPLPRSLALQGKKMTDPQSYELLLEVTQRRSDLGPETTNQNTTSQSTTNQSMNWQGGRQEVAGRWTGGPR